MEAAAFDGLRDAVFTGPLQPYGTGIAFTDDPATQATADLTDETLLADLLARFARTYPGRDSSATASLWSQFYFASLLIPLTVLVLRADRPLPLDLRALRVRFCPHRGTPLCFHLTGQQDACSGHALLGDLFEHQVAPVVALLKRHSGLSARLLWENAGWYTAWVLGEIARTCPGETLLAEALLRDPQWPRGAAPTVAPLKGAALEGRPARRRLCCLRYRVDGFGRCPGTCPLRDEAPGQDA